MPAGRWLADVTAPAWPGHPVPASPGAPPSVVGAVSQTQRMVFTKAVTRSLSSSFYSGEWGTSASTVSLLVFLHINETELAPFNKLPTKGEKRIKRSLYCTCSVVGCQCPLQPCYSSTNDYVYKYVQFQSLFLL